MTQALRISEAASLALHSMVLLAARPEKPLSTHQAAAELGVSEAHLSKVFQRLARVGLVTSTRGPGGGFALLKTPDSVSLLEVYETMDGPLGCEECLMGAPTCDGEVCLLGGLIKSVNEAMRSYLSATHLSDVTATYSHKAGTPQEA